MHLDVEQGGHPKSGRARTTAFNRLYSKRFAGRGRSATERT